MIICYLVYTFVGKYFFSLATNLLWNFHRFTRMIFSFFSHKHVSFAKETQKHEHF